MQIASAEQAAQGLIDHAERAADGQNQQHESVDGNFNHADAHFGHRVIGGLAMVGQVDAAGEVGRHPVAMHDDMAQMPHVEPEAQGGSKGESQQKKQRELG